MLLRVTLGNLQWKIFFIAQGWWATFTQHEKCPNRVFSGPYSVQMQEVQTRKNFVFGHFSHSVKISFVNIFVRKTHKSSLKN